MGYTITDLQNALEIRFHDQSLLQTAFVHRSYLNENKSFPLPQNERLEFLGDAVLELIVTEYLYQHYQNPEGDLTAWRSSLVKGEHLAKKAVELGFPELLLLSRGETKSGGSDNGYLLANAFEAFLGALYLDQGYSVAKKVVEKVLLPDLTEIIQNKLYIDPKTRLQEFVQEKFGCTPHYQQISESGPDHAKEFEMAVLMNNEEIARGTGQSKQAAQVAAAASAFQKLTQNQN